MNSYGETATAALMAAQPEMVAAALAGNRDALKALMESHAQTAYTAGFGASMSVGLPL